jgi:hypothetical protein
MNAKDEFNKVASQTKTVPNKSSAQTQGQGSEMVRQSQPPMRPKPPGSVGNVVDAQAHNANLAREKAEANQEAARLNRTPPRPVVELKHQQEGQRLHEKFKKAAQQDRQQGR